MEYPAPNKLYSGPGQAPANAQPIPNMVPPIIDPLLNCLSGITMASPFIAFTLNFLSNKIEIIPTAMADPIIPYIWKL